MIVALRAPSLAKFGEVNTVPVSEKPSALSTFRPLGYPIKRCPRIFSAVSRMNVKSAVIFF